MLEESEAKHELKLSTLSHDFDIIMLTETWFNDGVFDGEFINNRFIVYRRDREQITQKMNNGAGIMIAVKSTIK